MKDIYFDNSATTQVSAKAIAAALEMMTADYGNPSSAHHYGVMAARKLSDCRAQLAGLLNVNANELIFSGSGSESNNLAIFGAARACPPQRRRIIAGAGEHASVLLAGKALAQAGYDLQPAPLDRLGRVDLAALSELLTPETALVSLAQVNNETGTEQDLAAVGALIRQRAGKEAFFHIDGVQGFGKRPVDLAAWQADAYSLSGHKIHAPKGCGALWLKSGRRILPLIYGGGQENGLRAGTENMPAVAALAAAAGESYAVMTDRGRLVEALHTALVGGLRRALPDISVNGGGSPYIANISFFGVKSEVLLHTLEQGGIYVSAGSACHSRHKTASHVLLAMGLPPELADAAIRFSFSRYNTLDEVELALPLIVAAVEGLRGFNAKRAKNKRG